MRPRARSPFGRNTWNWPARNIAKKPSPANAKELCPDGKERQPSCNRCWLQHEQSSLSLEESYGTYVVCLGTNFKSDQLMLSESKCQIRNALSKFYTHGVPSRGLHRDIKSGRGLPTAFLIKSVTKDVRSNLQFCQRDFLWDYLRTSNPMKNPSNETCIL